MRSLVLVGFWWTPAHPQRRVAGTLRFDPALGIQLTLAGRLEDRPEDEFAFSSSLLEYRVLHGVTENEGRITVFRAFETNFRVDRYGVHRSRLHADFVLVGEQLQGEEHLVFERVSVRLTYLDDWMGASGLRVEFPRSDRGSCEFRAEYRVPETMRIDHEKVAIEFTPDPTVARSLASVTMRAPWQIVLSSQVAKPLNDWWRWIAAIQAFIDLASNQPNNVTCFHGSLATGDSNGEARTTKARLLYKPLFLTPELRRRYLTPEDCVFMRQDVRQRDTDLLASWLAAWTSKDLAFAWELFCVGWKHDPPFIDLRLLALVQAAEAYHRRSFSNEAMAAEAYSEHKRAVKEACPREHIDWLKQHLRGNQKSLNQRLRDLVGRAGPVIQPVTGSPDIFAKRVVEHRNRLIHGDAGGPTCSDPVATLQLVDQLLWLLRCQFLLDTGLSVSELSPLLRRNRAYTSLVSVGSPA
ncbi:MAG: hypothetical protein HY763_00320 [Planctomycetes bacterium]|nr:hypothetical protein [Planctomycetota bacterium]